jgi:hypothetical protein
VSLVFGFFWFNPWTNEKAPRGGLYIHMVDRTMMWQVTVKVVGMAQWFASTWPSHGLPRGNGKCPMRARKLNFKNKKGGLAKSGGQMESSKKYKPPPKLENYHSTYILICYNNNPKRGGS